MTRIVRVALATKMEEKMRVQTILAAIAVAGTLPVLNTVELPAATAAHSILKLDQEQAAYQGGLSLRVRTMQTITAGLTGTFRRVALPLCSPMASTRIALAVFDVATGSKLATARLTFLHSYSDCAWYDFNFPGNNPITAGEVLRLQVVREYGPAPLWGYETAGANQYTRGIGDWGGVAINFAFRTYVETSR